MRPAALLAAAAIVALLLLPAATGPASASTAIDLSVRVAPARIRATLGQRFSIRSTVTNRGRSSTGPLIAHLNVLSYDRSVYVDPEDWSSHRTRYLAALPAGGSTTVTWTVQAVGSGSFAVYVALLPGQAGASLPVAGPAIRVTVEQRTTIDAGGIVPLALGIPALLALLLAGVRLRRRW